MLMAVSVNNEKNVFIQIVRKFLSNILSTKMAALSRGSRLTRGHFTAVCSVSWPLTGSEAKVDHVLLQNLLF